MKAKAIERVRDALALLERAKSDGAMTTLDTDGRPIHWACAVGAAKANLQIALGELGVRLPDQP
jgi:hypothetical protein